MHIRRTCISVSVLVSFSFIKVWKCYNSFVFDNKEGQHLLSVILEVTISPGLATPNRLSNKTEILENGEGAKCAR